MDKHIVTTIEETHRLAHTVLSEYPRGGVLALTGELASGKTTFVQGLGHALGIKRLLSPTFTILRQYSSSPPLYHMDLYRLNSVQEALDIGLAEILSLPNAIVAIEWPEKITPILPQHTIHLDFVINPDGTRTISTRYGTKD
ncbi:tRNA (adenosine(37)-N6)-threonylcarbamoyltransferase complex ATPase subunit type 1 TsaE [Candidatus Collierbacteria bacterium RIFOXYB1_FULL_49_13]|uniref:tRNA threonylcarbamoyladenosine biosynthesis protein TsaE n=1 Tax=Candidatus Collierbacteria bacterium RIFOXYB1_FULL_49_13 TaxID=1817728 RepID=A0A1F5FHD3_9BACT|nr:MAG: tRNA (adenosine(37)-N6)-threonylcarbamoyltransferase complex ATPase subunit type 1 TsaE [Candidatus Collierbacteria bacterium RIFOXYB1_FULL_49_13]